MTRTAAPPPSSSSATYLVIASRTTMTAAAETKTRRSAALGILLLLLAGDAEPRVRQRIEPLEVDLLAALMAVTELLGRRVEAPERLVDVPEVAALLRGEQELLLALHGVGALVGHVERVGRQVAVGALQGRIEGLVVVAELLDDAGPLFEQSLLQMCQLLLVHCPSLR